MEESPGQISRSLLQERFDPSQEAPLPVQYPNASDYAPPKYYRYMTALSMLGQFTPAIPALLVLSQQKLLSVPGVPS